MAIDLEELKKKAREKLHGSVESYTESGEDADGKSTDTYSDQSDSKNATIESLRELARSKKAYSDSMQNGEVTIESIRANAQKKAGQLQQDYSYINSVLGTIQSYMDSSATGYSGISYQNYKTAITDARVKGNQIGKDIAALNQYLSENGSRLDSEYVTNLEDYLSKADDYRKGMLSIYDQMWDGYSQFATEDDYKAWQQDMAYRQKYAGKSYTELECLIEGIDANTSAEIAELERQMTALSDKGNELWEIGTPEALEERKSVNSQWGKLYKQVKEMRESASKGTPDISEEELAWLKEYAPETMTLREAQVKMVSTTGDENLFYTNLYNSKLMDQKMQILSEVSMPGENRTVLEALQYIVANNGNVSDSYKNTVMAEMKKAGVDPDEWYSLMTGDSNFSAGNFLDWLGASVVSGLGSFNKSITGTLDYYVGKPLQELGWKNNPISSVADHYSDAYNAQVFNRNLYKDKMGGGKAFDVAGSIIEGTVAAVPDAVLAFMTAGSSTAASSTKLATNAAYMSGNFLTKAGITVQNMARNPSFWLSYGRTYSGDYEQAKSMGASDTTAALCATITSLINSGIEVGFSGTSGIQGLPEELMGDSNKLLAWLLSAAEEGGEEVLQGFVNNLVAKVAYAPDTQLANLKEMAEEFGMGFSVGLLLGGGESVFVSSVNAYSNHEKNKRVKQIYGSSVEELIAEGLESDHDSLSYLLATKFQQRVNSGKELSGAEIAQLVQANEDAIRAENVQAIDAEEGNTTVNEQLMQVAREVTARKDTNSQTVATSGLNNEANETAYAGEKNSSEWRVDGGNTEYSGTILADTGETVKVAGVSAKDGNVLSYTLDNGKTVSGTELVLSENDALLANALGEMDISAEDANAIWQGYDGSISMEAYAAGVRLAYEYGYQGQKYGNIDTKAFDKGLPDTVKKLAYNLGRKAIALENAGPYNKNINTKEGANNGTGENVHLRQGVQRTDGTDSGRQVRGMEAAPGRVQERKAESRSEGDGRSAAKTEGRVNAKDLGVPGGIGERNLTMVDGSYSADAKQAIAEGTKNGLEVVCFTGGNLTIDGVGEVRAAICGDKVFIRADHPEFTAQQLLRHEMAHREFGHVGENLSGKVDVRKVYDRLVELCGGHEEPVKNIIAMYSEAFDMGYDAETGTDAMAMEVFTEIVCDSQADMNAFAPEDRADMEGFMQEIQRIAQEEKAQNKGRAPPQSGDGASFSKARRGRSIELETMENNRFQRLRQFHNDLPAQWYAYTRGYFYIYSNQSFMDYTVLVKARINEKNRADIDNFVEEVKNGTFDGAETFNRWTATFRRGKGRDFWYRISSAETGTVGRNDGMDGWKRGRKNSGNSEKSSGNKPKVDFSREALDTQGRELSKAQQEYFKNSKVRDEQGRLLVMYRGDQENFTVFDRKKSSYSNLYGRGFYFTNSASHAGQYGIAKPFYLNITKPVSTTERTITKSQMRKFLEAVADNVDEYSFENYGYGATVDGVLRSVYSGKNDFAMLYDVSQTAIGDMVAAVELFNKVNGTGYDGFILDTETVTFQSNQAKNVDNTNPTADPDIRFSREFVSKQMSEQEKLLEKANKALEKSNAKLQEDNQYLKQLLKLQRQVTGGTKFTKSSVEAAARELIKNSDAKGDVKELSVILNDFYEYVATGKELTWEDVMSKAQPAVDWLNGNRKEHFVREAYAQEVLDTMKGRSFYLDESQKSEAAHAYGSYQAFRQKMWGTVTVSDEASMSLDNFWKEMSEAHPFYFPEGTNSGDQVTGIVDALDRLKTAEESSSELLDGYTDEMRERELLHDVYDSFWRVSTLRTVADMKQREINALKAKHYAAMDKIRSEHKKAMTDLAADYKKRMKDLREAYRHRTDEKAARVKGRTTVEKQAKLLMNMLARPTKDAHVPSELQKPLEKLLDSIDFSSKQLNRGGEATIRDIAYTRALDAVRTAIAGQRNAMEGVSDGTFKLDIPDSFLEEIDKHNKTIIDATEGLDLTTNRVYDMSSDELADLGHILTVINKAIRDIDRLHMAGAKARVSELALDTQREMRQRSPVKGDTGNAAMWASYTPWYAFRRMGGAAQQIFHGLMAGQAKLARTADSVIKFSQKTFTEKEVKGWENEVHTIKLESGESIQMTTAQIMSFYCLSKRAQGEGHMMGGGIRIGTIKPRAGKDIVQKGHYVLTVSDIAAINSEMDSRQKKVADALQQYMEKTGGRLINEISKARWDYAAATEIGYFPIKTDDATRDVKDPGQDKTNLWALLNKSFTKALAPGAKNAMIVDSIFDVFADHMSQVAEYNAFALPLVDAMKWFNYRERIVMEDGHIKDVGVQRSIRDTLGTSAVKYFTDLMTDINSSQKAGRHENMAGRILSRAKVASVGFSLRVAIQQPTAILRASLILDAPELIKGAARIGTRELVKEMQAYSGIALWKSMGYYDLNISRGLQEQIKGDESFIDKANEVGMWLPGKMDEWTWARIWAACKEKVSKDTKLTGESLLQETAKLFEDVVYQTQVADSVLTRSSLMRSKGQFMKEATAFMAEPTISLNILLSAFQDYEHGHTTWEKAKRGLMIGFYGYALPAVANALITALADAWRDDDEYEDFLDKFNQALFGEESFLDGNLFSELNPLEKIPFIRDAISMLKGYSVTPGYADLIQSGIDLVDAYKKLLSGKGSKTIYGVLYQSLDVLGSAFGIGAAPALREVSGIWNHTIGALYPEMKLVRYEENKKQSIRDAYRRGYLTGEEAIQELLAAKVVDDEDEASKLVGKWQFEAEYPELADQITYTQYSRWETEGKPNGVTLDLFVKVAKFRDDGTSNSAKSQDEVKQYIESVSRNNRIRHALWCCFYKESTSPWK